MLGSLIGGCSYKNGLTLSLSRPRNSAVLVLVCTARIKRPMTLNVKRVSVNGHGTSFLLHLAPSTACCVGPTSIALKTSLPLKYSPPSPSSTTDMHPWQVHPQVSYPLSRILSDASPLWSIRLRRSHVSFAVCLRLGPWRRSAIRGERGLGPSSLDIPLNGLEYSDPGPVR